MNPMPDRSYRGLVLGLALLGLAADQATKYATFHWLYRGVPGPTSRDVWPGVFEFLCQYDDRSEPEEGLLPTLRTISADRLPRVNQGALFGLGNEYKHLSNGVFAAVSICAALAIMVWSRKPAAARDPTLCAALGLILAGTLGNLYDRLVFQGVRDFFHFYWFEWPVFNVADCCLVCGAGLLLLQAFGNRHPTAEVRPAEVTAVAEAK